MTPPTSPKDKDPLPTTNNTTETKESLEAKAAFTASLRSVGANFETELRERARNLHENAAAVEKQENELRRTTAELAKQNEAWGKVADQARDGLKEIGDVQNWAELIERDLLVIEETVRLAEEGGRYDDDLDDGDEDGGHGHGGVNGAVNGGVVMNGGSVEEGLGKGKEKSKGGWFGWW